MPRIVEYTPAWLTRPSMGFEIFSKASEDDKSNGTTAQKTSVERLMVRRGTQVFIVVENELRWTDLVYLKDAYESEVKSRQGRASLNDLNYPETIFRVCILLLQTGRHSY
jgi:nucleoporin NUP82